MKRLFYLGLLVLILLVLVWFVEPGGYLVVNKPQKSDAIIVLAGSDADTRYWHGMELLRAGYAPRLVLDSLSGIAYGQSFAELAQEFVAHTAGQFAGQVTVCPMYVDSTKDEAIEANKCLQRLQPPPRSLIIVTDDYHTRRALSIFRNRLPQYQWTAAATKNDFLFGQPWWKRREWAKTYFTESQKMLWWQLFDRWR